MSIRNFNFKLVEVNNHIVEFRCEDVVAKILVLEDDILRVLIHNKNGMKLDKTWLVAPGMADIPFEGRDRLDTTGFSLPKFNVEEIDGFVKITTSKIEANINLIDLKITWSYIENDTKVEFMKDRQTQAYNFKGELGEGIYHYISRGKNEQYFGLGEKSGDLNRFGKRYRMLNIDAMGYDAQTTDPLYKHIPFYITRNADNNLSYGIFYDNSSNAVFDMGQELDNYHGHYKYFYSVDGDLDYYVIAKKDIPSITKTFSWLTGKTIFAPKWSLDYSGSTMTYTDMPDAGEQLKKFVDLCEEHDILSGLFQLSSGYTSIGNKRYVFNWNRDKIPQPEELSKYFHDRGLRLCANIKPALLQDHPMFDELKEKGLFVKEEDSDNPYLCQYWDELGAHLDFTNMDTVNWWKEQVTKQLLEYGIDSTWNDNNEYEIWGNNKMKGFGKEINLELVRGIMPLLMMKASFEAQIEFNPNDRPYLISRSGCPGMQRYVQTWSGDNYTSWKTLKYNIKMGNGLSLSGVYNQGHDIGGFSGNAPEPELFVRWIQQGIMYPRLTIHSWNDDKTVNEPWMYPEYTKTVSNLLKQRNRMIPYIYDLLYKAHKNYEPMVKPTLYNFGGVDEKTFEENDEFMLGDALLVACVVNKGDRERTVYLPKNKLGWYDFNTHVWYECGQNVTIPAPLEYTPMLVQAGSIIPINEAKVTFKTKSNDERAFCIFPTKGNGAFKYECFEDDGITVDYEKNHLMYKFDVVTTESEILVTLKLEGEYKPKYNEISIYLPKDENRVLKVNGITLDNNKFKLNN